MAIELAKPDSACSDEILRWSAISAPLPGAQNAIPPYIVSARLSLSGRHGQTRRSRNLQPLSEAGWNRLNESTSHGLLLRLENTEVRTNFQQVAFPHGSATALRRHMLTAPCDDRYLIAFVDDPRRVSRRKGNTDKQASAKREKCHCHPKEDVCAERKTDQMFEK